MMNKLTFDAVIDGKEVKLAVKRPNYKQELDAHKIYNKTFRELTEAGAYIKTEIEDLLRKRNLWDDDKESLFKDLQKNLLDNEKTLARKNIKLSAAREIAIDMRVLRNKLQTLLIHKNELETNSAENQADNVRSNYLVSVCTVYNDTGKPVFSSYDDYLDKLNEETYAVMAASKFGTLRYNLDDEFFANLPENKFLKKYGFIDEKLRLIDKAGNLIDIDGRKVNESGQWINEAGEPIDADGTPINPETGEYKFDDAKFLDDDGNPID